MPTYCDVALPVPLDRAFTYEAGGDVPAVGARVLVPFSGQKLCGVVVRVHGDKPEYETKQIQQVLDREALLTDELMELARWLATYYVAPLGEVLRGMLPLTAEVKRQVVYALAEGGRRAKGRMFEDVEEQPARSAEDEAEQVEREVLRYLAEKGPTRLEKLRSATGAAKKHLDEMVKRRWLARESVAETRDARRLERVAALVPDARLPKLNENQQLILAELAAAGGTMTVRALRELAVPETTLGTLVRRGLVRMDEVPESFVMSTLGKAGQATHEHELNAAQQKALDEMVGAMGAGRFSPHLLYGVTGSGKTAVYLAAMRKALDAGRSAILLVPEIGLTPSMAGQLYAAFGGEVALLHSALTPDERAEQWHRIRRGEAWVVVGTRSAVFAPAVRLGLIIVDEEHDNSYKQEETPRYHGRDTAVMRAKLNEAVVVMGSATPSLESWANASSGKYKLMALNERVMERPLPTVELVDMRREFQETGTEALFSRKLVEETEATLQRGEQAIILLNRRGYSFVVMCRACGEKLECENCAISLTYHRPGASEGLHARAGTRLECHYCGYKTGVPKTCPKCASEHLYFLGAGSQQGEEKLQEIFPHARIGRMDRDTVRGRSDLERLLGRLHAGEINLLVGTQMIAKGHDIHGVTLVGVVGADFALGLPDFRAAERVFQLLTQVSGRAGRGELPGKVVVQTYHPDHYAIEFASKHDYLGFTAKELTYRKWMHYPPYTALANVVIQSTKYEEASAWSGTLRRWFDGVRMEGVRVLGPADAPIARIKRIFRRHFVLKAERRSALQSALKAMLAEAERAGIPRTALIVDVDAMQLM